MLIKLENQLKLHHVTIMHFCRCWRENWKSGLKTDLVVKSISFWCLSHRDCVSNFQACDIQMNWGGMNTTTHTQPAKHPALHPTLERHRGENYTLVECFFFFHEPSVSVWCRVPSRWGAAEVRVTEQKGVRRSLCDRNESRSHRWRTRLFDGGRVWCVCVCVCTVRKQMTREGGQKSEDERCRRV